METNWNQLIERYLENELSEEGRQAFEAELASNSELRDELEIHQTVRDGAARSAQRVQLASIGASYHRSVRMKQAGVAAAIVIGVGVTATVLFFGGKRSEKSVPKQEKPLTASVHTSVTAPETVSDSAVVAMEQLQTTIHRELSFVQRAKRKYSLSFLDSLESEMMNRLLHKEVQKDDDEVSETGDVIDSGEENHTAEKLYDTLIRKGFPSREFWLVKKDNSYGIANSKGLLVVIPKYDSIGKFDDLIPCLALVMDEKKFGFIDKTGKEVIPLVYDKVVENAKYRRKHGIPGLRGYREVELFHRKKPRTFYIFAGDNTTSYCGQNNAETELNK